VSDVHQAPGWWLASDGEWYPPVTVPEDMASHRAVPAPEERKQTMGRRAVFFTALALIAVGAAAFGYEISRGLESSITGDSPKQILALVNAAVQKEGSVHVATSLPSPRGGTATYVNDAATDSGRQTLTFGQARMTALVVAGTAYVKANQLAMTSLLQVSAPVAKRFANKWLSFPSGDPAYKSISQTLDLASLLQEVTPTGTLSKLSPSVVDGHSVIGLRGELPGELGGTLYVSTTGPPLPVEEVSPGSGGTTTAVFSNWGEPVNVTAPAGAIPGREAGVS
jgi:hypothetical protein